MKALMCRLFGHPGWQSQEIGFGSGIWTKPRCPRCGEVRDAERP